MDIDDIRKDIKVIIESSWVNGAFHSDTASLLIADYVKERLEQAAVEMKEVGFEWWDDD